jgi:hypothetical protein
MKKIIILLISIVLIASLARADTVNMNISVNGTANLNVTVNADDTLARQEISDTQVALNETQSDVYGTMTGSGPKDLILNEIDRGYGNPINGTGSLGSINEICSDAYLQQWLDKISLLPPKEFVDYVKTLGYDDESHINLIWTMCQQKYINQNQAQWSSDTVGMQGTDIFNYFKAVVNWLNTGEVSIYPNVEDVGTLLRNYFATNKDVHTLANKVKELEIRIEALERTMENTSSEEYCQSKIDLMKEYNLTGVRCGINSTIYWNAKKSNFNNYDTIAYTSCTEDWSCSDWSDCVSNLQTRKCVDKNGCGTFDNKPSESRGCMVVQNQVSPMANNEVEYQKVMNELIKKEPKEATFLSLNLIDWIESIVVGIVIAVIMIFLIKRKNNLSSS